MNIEKAPGILARLEIIRNWGIPNLAHSAYDIPIQPGSGLIDTIDRRRTSSMKSNVVIEGHHPRLEPEGWLAS